MPPLWALGFHQCRWSYYPDQRVRTIAKEFRKRQIPCDAIYLDIDYMDGYRCFTVNKKYFPDLKKLVSDLKEGGFQTVVMIDPGIRVDDDYFVYQEGLGQDIFCRRLNGEMMRGPVWPLECVWPDYTRPDVRKWWGELYREFYESINISGFWNDMNEPAVFKVISKTFPDGVKHNFEGWPTGHTRIHNVYGQQMSRATQEGLKNIKPKKRPLVITRASYAGGQRYASVWTGDNIATWEHLKIANRQCLRMSISGFSFVGTDIGGFVDQPTGELMVRWLQLGIFHPLFRVHSMGNNLDGAAAVEEEAVKELERMNYLPQEPWAFGDEYTVHAKTAIELRYQLLPYLYTVFRNHTVTGEPVLKPLSFYNQEDVNVLLEEMSFLYGDQLLIHPITDPDQKLEMMYLPEGEWYYYWSNKLLKGGEEIAIVVQLSEIPILVKAGAVIPHYPIQQHTNEKPIELLTLKVYFAEGIHASIIYEDAGEGYDFEKGQYSLKTIIQEGSSTSVKLSIEKEGDYQDTYKEMLIEWIGLPFEPQQITIDGNEIPLKKIGKKERPVYQLKCSSSVKLLEISK